MLCGGFCRCWSVGSGAIQGTLVDDLTGTYSHVCGIADLLSRTGSSHRLNQAARKMTSVRAAVGVFSAYLFCRCRVGGGCSRLAWD